MRKKDSKARMGRPPKLRAEKWGWRVTVNMTRKEREQLEAEAKRFGMSLSQLLMRPWRKNTD